MKKLNQSKKLQSTAKLEETGIGYALKLEEKEMATYSSTLAWKTVWMEEPGRLQSIGSQRVGHDSVTKSPIYI